MSTSERRRKTQGGSECYVRVKQSNFLNHKPFKHTNDFSEIKAFINFYTEVHRKKRYK